jgi:hypothetical protein
LVRDLGRLFAARLGHTGARISVLAISPSSGISIELEPTDADYMAAFHSLAHEFSHAAPCLDPGTGLLLPPALQAFIDFWADPRRRTPPMEFRELARQTGALSMVARRRIIQDLRVLRSGAQLHLDGAPILRQWNLGFPPGATAVEIVGEIGEGKRRRMIAEPLVAVDRLLRCARTTRGLYRMRREIFENELKDRQS